MGLLISVVYESSVLMVVEGYFRCVMRKNFTMMKSGSYIWLCGLGPGGISRCALLLIVHLMLLFGSLFFGLGLPFILF